MATRITKVERASLFIQSWFWLYVAFFFVNRVASADTKEQVWFVRAFDAPRRARLDSSSRTWKCPDGRPIHDPTIVVGTDG
jgi:hypothetical protein